MWLWQWKYIDVVEFINLILPHTVTNQRHIATSLRTPSPNLHLSIVKFLQNLH